MDFLSCLVYAYVYVYLVVAIEFAVFRLFTHFKLHSLALSMSLRGRKNQT